MSSIAIEALVFCEHVFGFTKKTWEATKQSLRSWLGPGPADFLLVPDTDVVFPAAFQHTPIDDLLRYEGEEQEVRDHVGGSDSSVSRKRLPWLSVVYQNGSQTVDLSDWLAGVRWFASKEPRLLQMVRLYAVSHGIFLAEEAGATLDVITRQGEEECWRYVGCSGLERI